MRDVVVGFEVVIVKQFFARPDLAQGVNENSAASFADLAIGITGMINPSRLVSSNRRINDPFTIADCEIVHAGIVQFVWNARPQNPAAGVFDNAVASPKRFARENAATMNP